MSRTSFGLFHSFVDSSGVFTIFEYNPNCTMLLRSNKSNYCRTEQNSLISSRYKQHFQHFIKRGGCSEKALVFLHVFACIYLINSLL